MNQISFNQLCHHYNQSLGEQIFFQSSTNSYSYKSLLRQSQLLASKMLKLESNFLAIKLSDPFLVFCYQLAALMSSKRLLILSVRGPAHLSQSLAEHIPFDLLIEDQHALHQDLAKEIDLDFEGQSTYECHWPFEEPFLYVLSSGSSGMPKGMGHSLSTLYHSADSIIHFLDMKKEEKSFLNLPVNHVGGLMIFWRSFFSQGTVVTNNDKFDYISLVPVQLKRLISDLDKRAELQNAKAILVGGAKLTDDLKHESLQIGLRLYETYGMTETASLVMVNGVALPGQKIKLGNNQCFQIKGPTLSPGFYRNKIFYPLFLDENDFYHTQDKGIITAEGKYHFVERIDLNFKSGGELISPLAVEEIVKELGWISDCLLVPVPHYQWTEAGCLFFETNIVVKDAETLIKQYLKERTHPFLIPKFFHQHSFSSTGIKPSRFELKQVALKKCLLDKFHFELVPAEKIQQKLIVFFHGFLGELADLKPLAKIAVDQTKTTCLFIDLPGHGQTEVNNFKAPEEVFFELAQLIKNFHKDCDLYLYGYSMGGRVALELANNYLKVKKVFLESASFGLTSEIEKQERFKNDKLLFSATPFSLKDFLISWYANPLFHQYNLSEKFISDMAHKEQHDINQWRASLNLFSQGLGTLLEAQIKKIQSKQTKLTGIVGNEDKKYLNHYRDVMKNCAVDLVIIEEAGHNPHRTHLNELANALKDRLLA